MVWNHLQVRNTAYLFNLLNIVIGCLSWPIPRENTDYYYPIIPRLGVCGSKFPLFVAYFVQSSWIGDGHNSGEIFSVWRFMVQLRCFWIPTPRIGWSNPISLGRSTVEAQFSVSADRCVTEWNHRLADVTGKDKEAVAGKLAFTWVGCWRPICGVSPIEMGQPLADLQGFLDQTGPNVGSYACGKTCFCRNPSYISYIIKSYMCIFFRIYTYIYIM